MPKNARLIGIIGSLAIASLAISGCFKLVAVSTNNNDLVIPLAPDGQYNPTKKGPSGLYLYRLKQNDLRSLTTNDQQNGFPDFSPDGKRIAYVRNTDPKKLPQIRLLGLRDGNDRILTEGVYPDWSPKGSLIAFLALEKDPNGSIREENLKLRTVNTDGKVQDLGDKVSIDKAMPLFCWGNSRLLYFVPNFEAQQGRLAIKSVDIKTLKVEEVFKLTAENLRYVSSISCSPDERYLGLTVNLENDDKVLVIDLKKSIHQIIPSEGGMAMRNPLFSPGGTLSVSYGHDPWHIYLYKRQKDKWVKIKEILGTEKIGWWGNMAWFKPDGKPMMLAAFGSTDSPKDFYELHVVDPDSGKSTINVSKRVSAAYQRNKATPKNPEKQ